MKLVCMILALGIYLLLFFKANAQDYLPIVKENAEWTVLKIRTDTRLPTPPDPIDTSYVTTWIQGDTIISGIPFKKVFSREFSPGDNVPIYQGAIREENNVVTWIPAGQEITRLDTLYNFNLQVGDTVAYYRPMTPFYFYVGKIDTITTNDGVKRKRFRIDVTFLSQPTPGGQENIYAWIEGIGDIKYGLLYPLCIENSDQNCLNEFLCYKESERVVYERAPMICRTTSIKNVTNTNLVTLSPNPFSNTIDLKLNFPLNDDFQVNVYDLLGRSVFYKEYTFLTENILNINLGYLEKGTYFIELRQNDLKISKVIIKQ